jgi:hypothetical protein
MRRQPFSALLHCDWFGWLAQGWEKDRGARSVKIDEGARCDSRSFSQDEQENSSNGGMIKVLIKSIIRLIDELFYKPIRLYI